MKGKQRESRLYLGRDRVEREIRRATSIHRPHEPSPSNEEFERDEDFEFRRTEKSKFVFSSRVVRNGFSHSISSFGDLFDVESLRALAQRRLTIHFASNSIDVFGHRPHHLFAEDSLSSSSSLFVLPFSRFPEPFAGLCAVRSGEGRAAANASRSS